MLVVSWAIGAVACASASNVTGILITASSLPAKEALTVIVALPTPIPVTVLLAWSTVATLSLLVSIVYSNASVTILREIVSPTLPVYDSGVTVRVTFSLGSTTTLNGIASEYTPSFIALIVSITSSVEITLLEGT